MAYASVFCNNGLFKSQENLGFYGVKAQSLCRYSSLCYSSYRSRSLGFYNCCKFQHGLSHYKKLGSSLSRYGRLSLMGCNGKLALQLTPCCRNEFRKLEKRDSGYKDSYVEKKGKVYRRKFALRLRPRLRLLAMRVKRVSIRSVLNDFGTFLQRNLRKVTIAASASLVLLLCYVFLKVTAVPSPKAVPYSKLVTSLQSAEVTEVLFEEGSRLVYYNTRSSESKGNDNIVVEKQIETREELGNVPEEKGEDVSSITNAIDSSFQQKKLSQPHPKTPKWQYSTRKIVHDEKYLLSLMRDKGITYSSAPQSIIKSIRGTMITIISLWIPLTPMMWLVYRQFSAVNSPARKRQSNNQMIGFDDVEGVDSAKVELMEVTFSSFQAVTSNNLLLMVYLITHHIPFPCAIHSPDL